MQLFVEDGEELAEDLKDLYERQAGRYWDLFYRRNGARFFKDRHYLSAEFPELLEGVGQQAVQEQEGEQGVQEEEEGEGAPAAAGSAPALFDGGDSCGGGGGRGRHVVLEVGCGAGNTAFPLLDLHPDLFVYACDFSATAVQLVRQHAKYVSGRVHAFVADITDADACPLAARLGGPVRQPGADFCTMVFVLSAIHPDKMPQAVCNVAAALRPGSGRVLVRDYASDDLAMQRMAADGRKQKLGEGFYLRQDGTRAYYFSEDGLRVLFESCGFECEYVRTCHKRQTNAKRQLSMARRWIQGVFTLRQHNTQQQRQVQQQQQEKQQQQQQQEKQQRDKQRDKQQREEEREEEQRVDGANYDGDRGATSGATMQRQQQGGEQRHGALAAGGGTPAAASAASAKDNAVGSNGIAAGTSAGGRQEDAAARSGGHCPGPCAVLVDGVCCSVRPWQGQRGSGDDASHHARSGSSSNNSSSSSASVRPWQGGAGDDAAHHACSSSNSGGRSSSPSSLEADYPLLVSAVEGMPGIAQAHVLQVGAPLCGLCTLLLSRRSRSVTATHHSAACAAHLASNLERNADKVIIERVAVRQLNPSGLSAEPTAAETAAAYSAAAGGSCSGLPKAGRLVETAAESAAAYSAAAGGSSGLQKERRLPAGVSSLLRLRPRGYDVVVVHISGRADSRLGQTGGQQMADCLAAAALLLAAGSDARVVLLMAGSNGCVQPSASYGASANGGVRSCGGGGDDAFLESVDEMADAVGLVRADGTQKPSPPAAPPQGSGGGGGSCAYPPHVVLLQRHA